MISCVRKLKRRNEHENGQWGTQKIKGKKEAWKKEEEKKIEALPYPLCVAKRGSLINSRESTVGRELRVLSASRRSVVILFAKVELEVEHSVECSRRGEGYCAWNQIFKTSPRRALCSSFGHFDFKYK
uniref:Uncharacterized protein n=1 Tax=Solanum tuberosum TaxID=4113 RepID=M1DWX8_SOLTU